ncbi:MAG: flagellar filament capping protein FliD, partial [Verrucomicrobiota bacterium]
MDLSLSGLASGFDWKSLVDQLTDVERTPQKRLFSEQTLIAQRNNAYSSIKTQLGVLSNRITSLKEAAFFDARAAKVSDETVASAAVSSGAPAGQYGFSISQLASSARQLGTANAGASLNSSNDVSGLVLADAGFSTAFTAGNITVNGKQIAVATTDTLQDVFNRINTATGGVVSGSYDFTTDKITLSSSSGNVVLGSATDSSNFFAVTRLNNNGTSSVSSSTQLGGLKLTGALSAANFGTAITDGGSGAGSFKINGVAIAFNAATDSLTNVLDRINASSAGVNASFDAVNDRVVLTNKVTGDIGVALEDVAGNFLAASGLAGGTLERGKNLVYQLDGGPDLVSQTNTITQASSGVAGLSLSVVKEGAVTVTVASDTSKIKTAITDFMAEYNRLQSVVDSQTASTTDAKGKVTAGILANDSTAYDIGASLRQETNRIVSSMSGTLKRLDDLGITSNGNDNA